MDTPSNASSTRRWTLYGADAGAASSFALTRRRAPDTSFGRTVTATAKRHDDAGADDVPAPARAGRPTFLPFERGPAGEARWWATSRSCTRSTDRVARRTSRSAWCARPTRRGGHLPTFTLMLAEERRAELGFGARSLCPTTRVVGRRAVGERGRRRHRADRGHRAWDKPANPTVSTGRLLHLVDRRRWRRHRRMQPRPRAVHPVHRLARPDLPRALDQRPRRPCTRSAFV